MNIRKAGTEDISRIAEILVFTKRMNYRSIFRDDKFSFGNLQVLSAAREYINNPHLLDSIWVYDDEFVKGLIHIEGHCVKELYVDCFFEGQGIGGKLLEFAIENHAVTYLWVLKKNERAIAFMKDMVFSAKEYGAMKTERRKFFLKWNDNSPLPLFSALSKLTFLQYYNSRKVTFDVCFFI